MASVGVSWSPSNMSPVVKPGRASPIATMEDLDDFVSKSDSEPCNYSNSRHEAWSSGPSQQQQQLGNGPVGYTSSNSSSHCSSPDVQSTEPVSPTSDTRFLDVCMFGDVEDLVQLLEEMARSGESLVPAMLNMPDASGRVPVSHLCGNGMIEMLDLLEDIPGIDYNIPDNEGNTSLHFAAQAGHVEVVSFLLNKVRTIQVDPVNNLGFTPLMKSALQGRVKCSKLLLFSGASPSRRDFGRNYTAAQWSRYCGRYLCAEAIDKFVRTAVPGGTAIISTSTVTSGDKKSGRSSGPPFRSRSAQRASWFARTLKKAFLRDSGTDKKHEAEGDDKKKLTVPQIRVSKDPNAVDASEILEDDAFDDFATCDKVEQAPKKSKKKNKRK